MALHLAAVCTAALVAFAAPIPAQQPPIFPGRAHAIGKHPIDAATGDLTGDAIPDLVVADSNPSAIWWLLGTGAGNFAPAASLVAGHNPSAVAIDDMDGDGRADVVLADYKKVLVFHGDGAGGFPSSTSGVLKLSSEDMDVGDLNGDGRPDVATAGGGGALIEVLVASPSGGLSASTLYGVANNPGAIVLVDFDNDGDLDVATADIGNVVTAGTTVSIRRNSGSGTFAPYSAYTAGDRPHRIAAGDLDADGSMDVVTGNQGYPPLSILLGDGAGGLSAPMPHKVGYAVDVAIGDTNGDGKADVVSASVPYIGIGALLGDGLGGFADVVVYPAGGSAATVDLDDLDGDGGTDLVATNHDNVITLSDDNWRATVVLSAPTGGLASSSYFEFVGTSEGLGTSDFDADGRPDLAVAMSSPSPGVALWTGLSPIGFGPQSWYPHAGSPRDLAVGDWNGDGNADVATADAGGTPVPPGSTIAIGFGDGLGAFPTSALHSVGLAPDVLRSGDLNSDGVTDLIAQRAFGLFGSGDVWLLLSDGSGSLGVQHAGVLLGTVCTVGDANGDGLLDVVATSYAADFVCVLAGLPGGGFASGVCHPAGPAPKSAVLGDTNGDGMIDVVVVNAPSSAVLGTSVSVLLGLGSGAFGPPQSHQCSGYPSTVSVADVDADGALDVLAASKASAGSLTGAFELFLGDGAGGLGPPTPYSLTGTAQDLLVADFDLNGRPDLAVDDPEAYGTAVSILWNQLGTPAGLAPYGTGTPGCAGAQALLGNGVPKPNSPSFGLVVSNAPPDTNGWLLVGTAADVAGSDPLGLGFLLHVDPVAGPLAVLSIDSDAGGSAFAPVPIPNDPTAVGSTLHAQSLWSWSPSSACDPSPLLLSSSKGLSVTVQP